MESQQRDVWNGKFTTQQELCRVEGEKVRELQNRSIGALTFVDKNGQAGFGSAVLISDQVILTSAQNIFNRKFKTQNKNFKFYIGVDGVAKQHKDIEAWRYPQQFLSHPQHEILQFDFALMKLVEPIMLDRHLLLYLSCQQCIQIKQLKVSGFPCAYGNYNPLDKQAKSMKLYQYGLSRFGRVVYNDPSFFKIGYKIKVLPGMIGCPVLIDDSIVAIHVGEQQQCNFGRKIDDFIIERICIWRQQWNVSPSRLKKKSECPHRLNLSSLDRQYFDLFDYSNIKRLDLSFNAIQQVNLACCLSLEQLCLTLNNLRSIDLTLNTNLSLLNLSSNNLQKLDVSSNVNLIILQLSSNNISKLDVSKNTKLAYLSCSRNRLANIHLDNNTKLISLKLDNNNISAIDFRNNKNISHLCLNENKIKEINLTSIQKLEHLEICSNCLTEINLGENTNLAQLQVESNELKNIILSISENIPYQQYDDFYFSDQKSSVCRVQLRFNNQVARKIALQLIESWQERYSDIKDKHGCQYIFELS